jgi:RNA 2',3'-cyclic 3'-phosphodiesterase
MEYAFAMPARTTPPATRHDLFGQPKIHSETHRLFFALLPDDAVRKRICDAAALLQEQHAELRARWVKPERFHATLNFIGDYPELPATIIEQARSAADSLSASSFSWILDYAASFRGREPPCVLRGSVMPDRLLLLWQDMNKALARAALHRRVERQFTPHVTLAYARRELAGTAPITPITWQIGQFVLIHNVVGKGSYQVLGRWPLSP